MSTHIGAAPDRVAPRVLLPGDPLRAQWIAETFLDDVSAYNHVRNMLGYTGTYRGTPVSVQGSGMGQPSLAIYANELFREYDVRQIVRVGSCGALSPDLGLRDIVLGITASTDSSMNRLRFHGLDYAPAADFGLLEAASRAAGSRDVRTVVGPLFSTDSFYPPRPELSTLLAEHGVLAVEMEASALYTLAAQHGRRALAICTVSDHIVTGAETSADDRERTFADMVEIALESMLDVPAE
ncbi:MAG: purine-nucleoside phosphorylase [Nocardioidaceae bacterium]